jgi:diguanylate cyclase (GGDEF)-like protein
MLDLDHFKNFNDTYGHAPGDEVLKALGRLLRETVRASDIACRYGCEEFVWTSRSARDRAFRRDEFASTIPATDRTGSGNGPVLTVSGKDCEVQIFDI